MRETAQYISIEQTQIVAVNDQPTDAPVPVTVVSRLVPHPTVTIESNELPVAILSQEQCSIELANGARFQATLASCTPGTRRGSLIPAHQPATVRDTGAPLSEVSFSILNFPAVYGSGMKWITDDGTSRAIPCVRLKTPDWHVEMSDVQDIHAVAARLKQEGGYSVTYKGRIMRSTSAIFAVEEVEPLLVALRTFLSFARGAPCSLAAVEGIDQSGMRSWAQWGSHDCAPGRRNEQSWFRTHNGATILSDLFPKYWQLLQSDWSETLASVVHWYLDSNVSSAPHVGLILTQVALERLSHQILERGKSKGEGSAQYIRGALERIQIGADFDVSAGCPRLGHLQDVNGLGDSLHSGISGTIWSTRRPSLPR